VTMVVKVISERHRQDTCNAIAIALQKSAVQPQWKQACFVIYSSIYILNEIHPTFLSSYRCSRKYWRTPNRSKMFRCGANSFESTYTYI